MGKITLNEALKKASVKNDLQMFLGLDAQSELGGMTPERLAAVAGGKHQILPVGTDMDTVTTSGSYYLTNGVNTACDYSFYKILCLSASPDIDCFQIAYCITLNTIKTRTKANKRWSEWK